MPFRPGSAASRRGCSGTPAMILAGQQMIRLP